MAFSGEPAEYAYAQAWIEKIARMLNLSPGEDVFVIPGNHDIQRDTVSKSATIQGYHARLRDRNQNLNVALVEYLQKDDEAKRIIFKPLQNYNDFAAKYQCNISAEEPFWEHPFTLRDGSTLMVRGMNSSLISDELDSDTAHKLVVGDYQLGILRQDGVEYMILCHHPPQWLVDQESGGSLVPLCVKLKCSIPVWVLRSSVICGEGLVILDAIPASACRFVGLPRTCVG